MPKIFLIKDRLHQQQLRLQESQHLIQAKNSDQLNIEVNNERCSSKERNVDTQEPLSLVAKKRNIDDHQDRSNQIRSGKLNILYIKKANTRPIYRLRFCNSTIYVFLEEICMNSIHNSLLPRQKKSLRNFRKMFR